MGGGGWSHFYTCCLSEKPGQDGLSTWGEQQPGEELGSVEVLNSGSQLVLISLLTVHLFRLWSPCSSRTGATPANNCLTVPSLPPTLRRRGTPLAFQVILGY